MINLNKALFFDIETHRVNNWDQINKPLQQAFINHYYDPQTYETPEDHYNEIAGLHAEFSHVICVVFGYIHPVTQQFTTMELHGIDEVELIETCRKVFNAFCNEYYLAGHNILSCDIPYLVKRYIINGLEVPSMLNLYGQKPWDIDHLDTMEFWKLGSWSRVSLETICASLGIPCKTDELGGSNLYTYDISEMPWDELVHYCVEDVTSNYLMMDRILKYYPT